MVFEVVVYINGQVVLQGIDRVFGLLISLGPLGSLDDHVGHPIASAEGSE